MKYKLLIIVVLFTMCKGKETYDPMPVLKRIEQKLDSALSAYHANRKVSDSLDAIIKKNDIILKMQDSQISEIRKRLKNAR